MPKKPEEVFKEIKGGQYAPLYFLYGEEPFHIDQLAAYMETHVLQPQEKGFNQTVVYGKEANLRSILESARRFPMMAKRQFLLVKEAQEMGDLAKKEGQDALANYAKNPVPTTVLVFAYKHKKLAANTTLYKTLDKMAVLVESKRIYDNQVAGWIRDYAKESGYAITDKATNLLAEFIGNNMTRIVNEIQKVMLNYPPNTQLTDEMVMKHVGISKEFNIFELQTALAKKDAFKAYQIIQYFAANPKEHAPIMVVASLFGYFSKILLTHQFSGQSKEQIAGALGINPYFVGEYQTAAKHYPLRKVLGIIHFIYMADLQLKGVDSTSSGEDVIKELIFKILN
jgi:DNA polymerase-3 subunit delta